MRILLAGGTGAIGVPLLGRLVAAEHDVTVLTRSAERAGRVRESGARAIVGDALAEGTWSRAMDECGPEVVVNQLTSLPRTARRSDLVRGLEATGRLRTGATAALMAAAQGARVRRVVAQSIAFVYRPGPGKRTENDPLYLDGPGQIAKVVGPVAKLESATLSAGAVEGVVLRYGTFYGPGTYLAPGGVFAEMARRRRLPIVGQGRAMFGFLHVDDAASATVAALSGPPGIYNVVDDRPAPADEWIPELARLTGAKRPRSVPAWLAQLAIGAYSRYLMDEQPEVDNAKAKGKLAWQPSNPDWREGFASVFS